jgi:hypothetical protein
LLGEVWVSEEWAWVVVLLGEVLVSEERAWVMTGP